MNALAFLALQAAAAALPVPPADWNALPELPLPPGRGAFDPSAYVKREIAAGRCRPAGAALAAPVAVLMDAAGLVQRVVPAAIGCPTVEQFTAGYVSALARRAGNAAPMRPGWYRHVVTYRWQG